MAVASLLPNAEQTFINENGVPLARGSVFFYIPGTTTLKTTWQDAAKTILNTNPIILDAAGRAIIYGSGSYRQLVKDELGNTVWDQITQDPGFAATQLFTGTSITSVTIGTGTKNFVTQIGLGFAPGQFFTAVSAANNANYMFGVVTSYDEFAGTLILNSTVVGGSGTFSDWELSISGTAGPQGPAGIPQLGPKATLASNNTTNLGSTGVYVVSVTGTTPIVSFGSSASTNNPLYWVSFTGILVLTHNATSLILPGNANITTAVGDTLLAEYLGAGNWKVWWYSRAAVNPLPVPGTTGNVLTSNGTNWVSSASGTGATDQQVFAAGGTWNKPAGYSPTSLVLIECIGGGGGGGNSSGFLNVSGGSGGTTSFGTWVVAYGGSGGQSFIAGGVGGNGGGIGLTASPGSFADVLEGVGAGATSTTLNPLITAVSGTGAPTIIVSFFNKNGYYTGGGGGSGGVAGGNSVYGGAGGGNSPAGAGGISQFAGNGGAAGAVGTAPGGGGGGSSSGGGSAGGGGGSYKSRTVLLSSLGATETVTVGAGGTGAGGGGASAGAVGQVKVTVIG